MNSSLKVLVPFLALGLAGASFVRAADDAVSAVIPETNPDSSSGSGNKGGDGKRAQAMLENRLKQLDEQLKLTDDQKQKIKDIWAKQFEELKNLSPEERRAKGRDFLKATQNEVRALLTPEQQAKFDKMGPGSAGGGRPGHAGKGKKAE